MLRNARERNNGVPIKMELIGGTTPCCIFCLNEKKSILHTISQETSKGAGDCGCRKEESNTNGLLVARVPHADHIHRSWCVSLGTSRTGQFIKSVRGRKKDIIKKRARAEQWSNLRIQPDQERSGQHKEHPQF